MIGWDGVGANCWLPGRRLRLVMLVVHSRLTSCLAWLRQRAHAAPPQALHVHFMKKECPHRPAMIPQPLLRHMVVCFDRFGLGTSSNCCAGSPSESVSRCLPLAA
jgi:hypothetical protein